MRRPTAADARALAELLHAGQVDKVGRIYLEHLLRVADYFLGSDLLTSVAFLHDILEDTDVNEADLQRQGYSETVLLALRALTRREEEAYLDHIDRVSINSLAAVVKCADLYDHLLSIEELPARRRETLRHRYQNAWWLLEKNRPALVATFLQKRGLVDPTGRER